MHWQYITAFHEHLIKVDLLFSFHLFIVFPTSKESLNSEFVVSTASVNPCHAE